MTKINIADIVGKIVELMTPITSEERKRVVSASMTLLGENTPALKDVTRQDGDEDGHEELTDFPARAKTWIKKNKITQEQIDQVFHISEETVEIIADLPGSNNKENTYNAYVLIGIANLFESGVASFDDTSARELCKSSGCYSDKNHARYIGDRGNLFTGTKDKGWTLTSPGLKRGAEIILEIAQ